MDWIIPCDDKTYNHKAAFANLPFVDWKQSTNVKVGDTVYIYVGRPISSILYKCYVKETDISTPSNNDVAYRLSDNPVDPVGRYMRLLLIYRYPAGLFSKEVILDNGLKTVQGPSRMPDTLRNYILAHETDNPYITSAVIENKASLSCEFRREDGDHERHDCLITFKLLNHHVWSEFVDGVCFELVKAATKKLDTYHNPEDFVSGYIYYKSGEGDPAIGVEIERKNNQWVFTSSKEVKCKEKTTFYADGRKDVELIRDNSNQRAISGKIGKCRK